MIVKDGDAKQSFKFEYKGTNEEVIWYREMLLVALRKLGLSAPVTLRD